MSIGQDRRATALPTRRPERPRRPTTGDPAGTLPDRAARRSTQELAAGSTEEIRFVLHSAVVDEVTLTVTGDPGITVSPTTVAATGTLVLATVSAGAGSEGATATITATAGDLRPATMSITVS